MVPANLPGVVRNAGASRALRGAGRTRPLRQQSLMNGRFWPFSLVNEGFNGAESDFRFVLESGRSECWDMGSSLWLLLANGVEKGGI